MKVAALYMVLLVACGDIDASRPGNADADPSATSSGTGTSTKRGGSPSTGEPLLDAGGARDVPVPTLGPVDSLPSPAAGDGSSPRSPRDSSSGAGGVGDAGSVDGSVGGVGGGGDSGSSTSAPSDGGTSQGSDFVLEDYSLYPGSLSYPPGLTEGISKMARAACVRVGLPRPDGVPCSFEGVVEGVRTPKGPITIPGLPATCTAGVCCPGCWDGKQCHVTSRGIVVNVLYIYSHSKSPAYCGGLGSRCMACPTGCYTGEFVACAPPSP